MCLFVKRIEKRGKNLLKTGIRAGGLKEESL